jgi:hypothetical protein
VCFVSARTELCETRYFDIPERLRSRRNRSFGRKPTRSLGEGVLVYGANTAVGVPLFGDGVHSTTAGNTYSQLLLPRRGVCRAGLGVSR